MRVKCKIGNAYIDVVAWVSLENEQVYCVEYKGVNIVDALEIETLDKIVEAAEEKFRTEMSEP